LFCPKFRHCRNFGHFIPSLSLYCQQLTVGHQAAFFQFAVQSAIQDGRMKRHPLRVRVELAREEIGEQGWPKENGYSKRIQ
jgi:hypothetical protein